MTAPAPHRQSTDLIQSLGRVLPDLQQNPYAVVPSPPGVPKRASVALIIRILPQYEHWPPDEALSSHPQADLGISPKERLEKFFTQEWVEHGDPEILFIKRAARKGDKWTGHIALPGGGREPADTDDQAAAVRETREEVGLDLSEDRCIPVGNLPQQVVASSWGKVPYV